MFSVVMILGVLFSHTMGDFVFQSNWMAMNKSKNWWALITHVGAYSLCFIPFGREFVVITWVLHFIVDAITSRITSKLWFIEYLNEPDLEVFDGRFVGRMNDEKRHWFFVAIGLDQFIHFASLFLTLSYLGR